MPASDDAGATEPLGDENLPLRAIVPNMACYPAQAENHGHQGPDHPRFHAEQYRSAMQRCKTCRHWAHPNGWNYNPLEGLCRREGTIEDDRMCLSIATEGSNKADLLTGPDFGCVLHEPDPDGDVV